MATKPPNSNRALLRFTIAVAVVSVVGLAISQLFGPDDSSRKGPGTSTDSVAVAIDFEQGQPPREWQVDYQADMTVAAALRSVPGVELAISGQGESTFLAAIDGIENGTNDRWWLFEVNGERSKTGAGTYPLQPGDRVLWRFTHYD